MIIYVNAAVRAVASIERWVGVIFYWVIIKGIITPLCHRGSELFKFCMFGPGSSALISSIARDSQWLLEPCHHRSVEMSRFAPPMKPWFEAAITDSPLQHTPCHNWCLSIAARSVIKPIQIHKQVALFNDHSSLEPPLRPAIGQRFYLLPRRTARRTKES